VALGLDNELFRFESAHEFFPVRLQPRARGTLQVSRHEALFGGNDDAHLLEPGQLLGGAELIHTQATRLTITPVKGNAEFCQHAWQRATLPGAAMERKEDIFLRAEKRFE